VEYISIKDAAAKWGVSVTRVYRYVTDKRIKGAYMVGRTWLIPAEAQKPTDPRIKKGFHTNKK
jgi:excisionase family DNA binding protein